MKSVVYYCTAFMICVGCSVENEKVIAVKQTDVTRKSKMLGSDALEIECSNNCLDTISVRTLILCSKKLKFATPTDTLVLGETNFNVLLNTKFNKNRYLHTIIKSDSNFYHFTFDNKYKIGKFLQLDCDAEFVLDGFLTCNSNRWFFISYSERIPCSMSINKVDYRIGAVMFLNPFLKVKSFLVNRCGYRHEERKVIYKKGVYDYEICYKFNSGFSYESNTRIDDIVKDSKNEKKEHMRLKEDFLDFKKEKYLWLQPFVGYDDYVVL